MTSHILEYIILSVLFIIQLWIIFSLGQKVKYYTDIFRVMPEIISPKTFNLSDAINNNIEDENSTEEINNYECIKAKHDNETFTTITKSINNYTTNNNGIGIDYHLIKDIVDRNIDVIVNDIENRIPGPLYIGLAGTMFGIIMGLTKVNFDLGLNTNDVALSAIQPLIDGVKYAMWISVFGLALTTVFSIWVFKNATVKVENAKNEFLSLVQTELLPKVNNSQLPEIEVLSNKLDDFSRTAITVLEAMQYAISTTSKAISRESEILDKINNLEVNEMAKSNIETFNKLNMMMGSIETFSSNFSELSDSLSSTNSIAINLRDFVDNTSKVSEALENINQNVEESNLMYQYFNTHIKSFEKYGNAVNEAVTNADSRMVKAVALLSEVSGKEISAINESITLYDQKLTKSFEASIDRFEKSMTAQVKRTEEAFEEGRPKFEQLEQLKHLEKISQGLSESNSKLYGYLESAGQNVAENNSKLDMHLIEINQNIDKSNLTLNEYLRKVDKMSNEVLEELKKQKSKKVSKPSKTKEVPIKSKEEKSSSEISQAENNNKKAKKQKKLTFKEVFFFWKKTPKK